MNASITCSHSYGSSSCRNVTVDPSGLCHRHRTPQSANISTPGAASIPQLGKSVKEDGPQPDEAVGREGFQRVFDYWTRTQHSRSFIGILDDLGPRSHRTLARKCANLTERESFTVIMALAQDENDYPVDFHSPFKRQFQQWVGRQRLARTIDKLVAITPACCAFDPYKQAPYLDLAMSLSRERKQPRTRWQKVREAVFGMDQQRQNALRGDALRDISNLQMPREDAEWFGANWKTVQPIWERLMEEKAVTRARAEVLLDEGYKDVPDVLMDGAL